MEQEVIDTSRILCVDLDGTLIRTDLLHESIFLLLKKNPFYLFLLIFWLFKGRAALKREIAKRLTLHPQLLPYNYHFLDYLVDQQKSGRRLMLATASDLLLVEPIVEHLGIFDEVLASDGEINCKGINKLNVIKEKLGEDSFDYAGDSKADLKIWQEAEEAVVVSSSKNLISQVQKICKIKYLFEDEERKPFWKVFLKEIRVYQWVKNLLLFVPAVMAHEKRPDIFGALALAFLAFSLCASSVYLLNDLVDLEADRENQFKKKRPLAAGEISLLFGSALAPLFLAAGILLALLLPVNFVITLGVYYVTTFAYSFWLKRIAVVDILVLALLYVLRVMAGGYAVDVNVSFWLLAVSMFIFLSLACVKRLSELLTLKKENRSEVRGRGYFAADLEPITQFGLTSGYLSVLVLALYINSREVVELYRQPRVLWLLCPLILYWISRIWLLAHRGEVHEDPIIFAIKDLNSYFVGLIGVIILFFAI